MVEETCGIAGLNFESRDTLQQPFDCSNSKFAYGTAGQQSFHTSFVHFAFETLGLILMVVKK